MNEVSDQFNQGAPILFRSLPWLVALLTVANLKAKLPPRIPYLRHGEIVDKTIAPVAIQDGTEVAAVVLDQIQA